VLCAYPFNSNCFLLLLLESAACHSTRVRIADGRVVIRSTAESTRAHPLGPPTRSLLLPATPPACPLQHVQPPRLTRLLCTTTPPDPTPSFRVLLSLAGPSLSPHRLSIRSRSPHRSRTVGRYRACASCPVSFWGHPWLAEVIGSISDTRFRPGSPLRRYPFVFPRPFPTISTG
jgi:hypothetical protein